MDTEVILAGGTRTPFGGFGRSLKDVPLAVLGTHAAKATLAKAGLDPRHVDHLVWGNTAPVDAEGYFASRVIALGSGLPVESAALNASRAGGSGQGMALLIQNIRVAG